MAQWGHITPNCNVLIQARLGTFVARHVSLHMSLSTVKQSNKEKFRNRLLGKAGDRRNEQMRAARAEEGQDR